MIKCLATEVYWSMYFVRDLVLGYRVMVHVVLLVDEDDRDGVGGWEGLLVCQSLVFFVERYISYGGDLCLSETY